MTVPRTASPSSRLPDRGPALPLRKARREAINATEDNLSTHDQKAQALCGGTREFLYPRRVGQKGLLTLEYLYISKYLEDRVQLYIQSSAMSPLRTYSQLYTVVWGERGVVLSFD